VADLEAGPQRVRWELGLPWLRWALDGTDASLLEPGELAVELLKNGRDVIVRGNAKLRVTMPCAKTLDPVDVALEPDVFLMLSPSPNDETPGRRRSAARNQPGDRRAEKRPRKRRGKAPSWEATPELSEQAAAHDTYTADQIVLDDFVREFILLELPMSVVRSDLLTETGAAYGPPPETADKPIDPRLQPLAEIKSRLEKSKE